jgi:glycosyltransferase involved in cell wall biosynthesis
LASYPSPTETFIAREVEALRRRGVGVSVYTLAGTAAARGGVLYRSGWSWARVGLGVARCLVTRPRAAASALGWSLSLGGRPVYALKLLANLLRAAPLVAWAETEGVERIHAHFADIPADLAITLGRLAGLPVTFSAHARDIFVRPVRLAQKCRVVRGVFACSRAAERTLTSISRGAAIHLMRHGLDFSDPALSRAYEVRARRSRPDARVAPRLLAVGRFVRKKGFHVLVEALRLLAQRGVAFECRMIGGGEQWESLKIQVEAAGLSGQVALMPHRPWPGLSAELEECDLFIQPSVVGEDGDRDGIPNVILEAFAVGVPVVASDLPSLAEVVRDGVTGLSAAAGSAESLAAAVEHALSNPEAGREMSRRAREEVLEMFDVNRNVSVMLGCWQQACENPARAARVRR